MSSDKHASKRSTKTKEKTTIPKASTSSTNSKATIKAKGEKQEKILTKTSEGSDERLDKKLSFSQTSRSSTALKQKTKNLENSEKSSKSKIITSTRRISNGINISSNSKKPLVQSKQKGSTIPPKKGVEKTQYFPSKSLYSNALKSINASSKVPENNIKLSDGDLVSSKEKKSIRKPVTTSVKVSKSMKEPSSVRAKKKTDITRTPSIESSISEQSFACDRPRTATLRKGSIVNENIVGPEAPKPLIQNNILEKPLLRTGSSQMTLDSSDKSNDDDYDDDFESYESDFEAVSSSEDTNLAELSGDTGSTTSSAEDISDKPNTSPLNVYSDNKRLSSAGTDSERKLDSGTFELSDFKHRQILRYIEDTIKKDNIILEQSSSIVKESHHTSFSDEGFEDQRSLQFINFVDAKKKCEKKRLNEARRQRGKELLSMIKLDTINFTVFDLPSIPYEVYISNYGEYNSVQISIQTGDDDLCEESQTDTLSTNSVWTQMPNKFTDFNTETQGFWDLYKTELLGVGSNKFDKDFNLKSNNKLEKGHLDKFISQSGELILQILSEENINRIESIVQTTNNLPFSKGFLTFNTHSDIFKDTKVSSICIQQKNVKKFLSLHVQNKATSDLFKSMVCLWAVDEPEMPRAVLFSYGDLNCISVCNENEKLILAGQTDGSINIWNLDEKNTFHESSERTPSFITPIGSSHLANIISVQSVYQQWNKDEIKNNYEICSLDETGTIFLWSLYIDTNSTNFNKNLSLINTRVIQLQGIYPHLPDLACSDCIIMNDHVYLSTNYGIILHYNIQSSQPVIKQYNPELPNIETTTLEGCPFYPSYFLAGHSNGDITLFSRNTEKPLLVLQNKEENVSSSVQTIRWSKTKPFVFYAKDSKNNLHIWDLGKSDMYPEYTIRFPEKITCMTLSPILNMKVEESPFMLIGTKEGKIYLHLLNEEYCQKSSEQYQEHIQIFLDYVSRL
ncbi:cytoplasmic dynein 2 intermediate chain 1 [Anthonomus grandis grandis]|uniref:cytoplasmic dynein 2 intermediate chain 1 n=1 Tax=Anthonomus grandis grandis TaxID=2921223 RepID=UPI00216609FD|nr:cytoplasmic dynein 2 intermediate chain 1 [Anthonomus grandis grandis]